MSFAPLFLGAGIAIWVAAGVLLYATRKQLRKTVLMGRVETSLAFEVAVPSMGTPVEVKGTLRCETPLRSEMAGQECVYYLSQVIREYNVTDYDSDGASRTRRRTKVMPSNERFAPFAVEDDSGVIGIRGEGAEVDALEVMNRFENNSGKEGSFTLGGPKAHLAGAGAIGYRYVEGVLPVDAPVYTCSGLTGSWGHIGGSAEEEKEGSGY